MSRGRRVLSRCCIWAVVVVTLLGLSLPILLDLAPTHLARVDSLVSSALGKTVQIGSLQVVWHGLKPQLTLHHLNLRDDADSYDLVRFDRAQLEIDFLSSLRHGAFRVAMLDLHIPELRILRDANGDIAVEGFDPRSNVIGRWLLQQRHLRVTTEALIWRDETLSGQPHILGRLRLLAEAHGPQHKVNVMLQNTPQTAGQVEIGLEYTGDLFAGEWQGNSYLSADDLAQGWLKALTPLAGRLPPGAQRFSTKIWTAWAEGRARSATGHFALAADPLVSANLARVTKRLDGDFNMTAERPRVWRCTVGKLELTTPASAVHLHELGVRVDATKSPPGIGFEADSLPLASVGPIAQFLAPDLTRNAWWQDSQLQGMVRRLRYFNPPEQIDATGSQWTADLEGIGFLPVGPWPGINGVSGTLTGRQDEVHGQLGIKGGTIDDPTRFPSAIAVTDATAEFALQGQAAQWRLAVPSLSLHTADFALRGEATMSDAGQGVFADLALTMDHLEAKRLAHYFPISVPARVRDWWATAVKGGAAKAVTAKLSGPLAAFPFEGHEGVLWVEGELQDGRLAFLPHWPELENINARFNYSGREVHLLKATGTSLGAKLHDFDTDILALGTDAPRLNLVGQASADAAVSLRYLAASPLNDLLPTGPERLQASGAVDLRLGVKLAFDSLSPAIAGEVELRNNTLQVPGTAERLQTLSGKVGFSETGIRTVTARGRYRMQPVLLSFEPKSRQLKARMDADARLLNLGLRKFLTPIGYGLNASRVGEIFRGRASLEFAVDTAHAESNGQRRLVLHSGLKGLAIDMPLPLGKGIAETLPLEVTTTFAENGVAAVDAIYGKRARANFKVGLNQVAVTLGSKPVTVPAEVNYWLGGSTEQLSVMAWRDFVNKLVRPNQGVAPQAPHAAIDVTVDRLDLGDFLLHATRIRAVGDRQRRWRVSLSGPDANGIVRYFPNSQRLSGVFKYFWLHPAPALGSGVNLDPRLLPNIDVDCDDCRYGDMHLGKLELSGRSDPKGFRIQRMGFTNESMRLHGTGTWSVNGTEDSSSFEIRAEADELGKLLGQFGYSDSGFVEGKATFDILANWSGPPMDFDLARLAGHLHMKIENGRLLSVDNRVGRIFGLLSIDTFWRRLSLDFRDIFGQGFAFDRIEGDFAVTDGIATTQNMVLQGPAARVDVRGITGLAGQFVDQTATVSPAIASTLPVASALFGPAGVGVGAAWFLAGKVFPVLPRGLDALMRSEYTIKGPWSGPEVKKISGF